MHIRHYISNYKKYIYESLAEKPLRKIIESSECEHYLIIPISMTIHYKEFAKVFDHYYLAEMFDLSNCFLGTHNEPYIFLHIVSRPVETIKISGYDCPAHKYRDDYYNPDSNIVQPPKDYLSSFLIYLKSLDNWMNANECPKPQNAQCEFRELPYIEFNSDIIYTKFYLSRNDNLRLLLKNEQIVELNELADVKDVFAENIFNESEKNEWSWSLKPDHIPEYPYKPEREAIPYVTSTVQIHKNDIIFIDKKVFLINKESSFPLFAPPQSKVIRVKNGVSPEYLYIYLRGQMAWSLYRIYNIPSGENRTAILKPFQHFPVVLPKESDSYYQELFEKISNPDEQYFKTTTQLPPKTVSEVLTAECIESIKLKHRQTIQNDVKKDLTELNKCFEAKAFKATIVFAATILEFFLIDWLSELDGVDYVSDYKSLEKYDTSFYKYIEEINNRVQNWTEFKDKAHTIRKDRNTLHLNRALSQTYEFDEKKCRKTINDLQEILFSRKTFISTNT